MDFTNHRNCDSIPSIRFPRSACPVAKKAISAKSESDQAVARFGGENFGLAGLSRLGGVGHAAQGGWPANQRADASGDGLQKRPQL